MTFWQKLLCGLYGLKFQHKLRENYINVYYLFLRRISYNAAFQKSFKYLIEDRKYFFLILKTLPKIGYILFCREKFLNGLSMDKNCHKPQTPWLLVISGQQRTKNDKLYTLKTHQIHCLDSLLWKSSVHGVGHWSDD